jgi:adenosine deaminase
MRDLALLPKVHLHVHLESTLRWSTLRDLGSANGVPVPEHLAGTGRRFDGFRDFADGNALIRACLQRAADFRRMAREFCADEAAQGTAYAEVSFSASSHGDRLGDPAMPLRAVLDGLAEGRASYGIEVRVLLDHSRRKVERASRSLALGIRYAADGVAGIGLAGDESYPLTPFKAMVDGAAEAGLHLVHHAGETAGPDSIREALTAGRADRIGHGIRVLEDPDLGAELRDRRVPLEVCPSSNVALGLVPSYPAHPLPRLVGAGLAVTVSTDIPNVLGVSLTGELERVRDTFGYDDARLAALNHAAIDASFAPAETKTRLHAATDRWLATD